MIEQQQIEIARCWYVKRDRIPTLPMVIFPRSPANEFRNDMF
jgi:hypothetical protein